MICAAGSIDWNLHSPCAPRARSLKQTPPHWLHDLWSFRGRILHENGRRPLFARGDGAYCDDDETDERAYHLLAREADRIVGCIRFVPLDNVNRCLTETVLGPHCFQQLLADLRVPRSSVVETGRWCVDPDVHHPRLALELIAGVWAALQLLGYRVSLGAAGTRGGQDRILRRTGLFEVAGVEPRYDPAYDDEIRVMAAVISRPAPNIASLVDRMRDRLHGELAVQEIA